MIVRWASATSVVASHITTDITMFVTYIMVSRVASVVGNTFTSVVASHSSAHITIPIDTYFASLTASFAALLFASRFAFCVASRIES